MSDTIGRQAAIDAIEHSLAEPAYQHTGEDWYTGMNCAESELYDLPSARSEETCDTCKHGNFGSRQCDNCRVRYPSHYERRTDDRE